MYRSMLNLCTQYPHSNIQSTVHIPSGCMTFAQPNQKCKYYTGIYLRPPRIDDHPSTTTTSNPSLAPDFTPGPLSTISSVAASVRHSVVDFRAVIHHHHPHHHGSSYHGSATHAGSSSFYGIGNSSATSGNHVAGSSGTSGGGVGPSLLTTSSSSTTANEAPHSPTPPLQRRLAKSFSVAPSSSQSKGWIFLSLIVFPYTCCVRTDFSFVHYFLCPNMCRLCDQA